MKWSEMRRLIERNGWVLIKYGKKHDEYEKNGKRVLLERHFAAEVKPKLYFKLLKQMDLK
jgi:predicted RNA binding protein YcfA (HicA-like mRNA interferase family)